MRPQKNNGSVDIEDFSDDAHEEEDCENTPDSKSGKPDEDNSDGSTQEIAKSVRHGRSNSLTFDRHGTSSPMKYSDRNTTTEDSEVDQAAMKDAIVISVISLEVAARCYKKFHENLKKDKTYNAVTRGVLKPSTERELVKNVNYTSAREYQSAFSEILKNKEPAHCVPIVEGPRDDLPNFFTTEDCRGKSYRYERNAFYLQGKTDKGAKDDRQSINFYLRSDAQNIFSFEEVEIPCSSGKGFPAVEIIFSTVDEQKFSTLVVHIPNRLTGSQKACKAVHQDLEKYAEQRKNQDNIILSGYVGDTNYQNLAQENSQPSYGGNQGKNYKSPTSSGAKERTYFMQGVSLAKSKRVRFSQPSTLNQVKLDHTKTTNTDHPSIQIIIQMDAKIKNKNRKVVSAVRGGLFGRKKSESEPIMRSSDHQFTYE